MKHLLAAAFAVVVTSAAIAADEVGIRERYWQVLREVSWVYTDYAGNPWFCTRDGDPATSYNAKFKQLRYDQVLLLGDRKGRLWINPRYDGAKPTRYFDGKKWHDTGIHARHAFEDGAGRVFLADPTHVHVFDGDTWTKQKVFPTERQTEMHFAIDAKGRVWFWAPKYDGGHWGKYPGTDGVWCIDQGKWMNYRVKDGLPTDNVACLIPWTEDRFIVVRADREAPNYAAWSPSRKLMEAEGRILPAQQPTQLYYRGVDMDGILYFGAEGLKPDPEDQWARNRVVLLTPKGDARVLTKAEAEKAQRWPSGLYENRARIFARAGQEPPAVPCQPGEAIAVDRDGRIYFRWHSGVGVLWPKFEKAGNVLRLQSDPRGITPIRGVDGAIWGVTRHSPDRLMRWDGKTWEKTPVSIPPHPGWQARPAPPWNRWSHQTPLFLPGRGGTMLAVAIRDIYQEILLEKRGGQIDHWELSRLGRERIEKTGADHWPVASLFHKGDWIGPKGLIDLLKSQRSELTEAAVRPTVHGSWLDLQSDGRRPWLVHDRKVYAFDADGVREWAVPGESSNAWDECNLCLLADGRMLLSHPTKDGYRLKALSLKDGRIVAEEFPTPNWGDAYVHSVSPALYAARDGSLWAWLSNRNHRGSVPMFEYRDGKWTSREDLGPFLLEEPDGSLWFHPGQGGQGTNNPERGYRVVKGQKTSKFKWLPEHELGDLTPTGDGRLLAACGYFLVELGKADDPLKRPVKAHLTDRYIGAGPAFEGKDGTVFVPSHWGK